MTREEKLKLAKDRAIDFANRGHIKSAWIYLVNDLRGHNDLANHPLIGVGMVEIYNGRLNTADKMIAFINLFD